MQELTADTELKFDVNQTHTVARSVAPSESAYSNANIWLAPDPLAGVTETALTVATVAGTVQTPMFCHPLLALAPPANIKVFFAPAYAGVNVVGRFKVRFVPDGVTLAAATLIEH